MCFIRTPNITVQLLRARLKKLAFGVRPNFAYLMARDHSHHYSMRTIRSLLERNGFSRIAFVHLHPIGATSGGNDAVVRLVKGACFAAAKALDTVTVGRLNLDNLFVVAYK